MLKRNGFMKVVSLLLLSVLFIATAVSCGGGGGESGPPPAFNYSDPNQAASASSEAAGSVAFTQTMGGVASAMAGDGAAQGGYSAPNKRKTANTDAIANIDPRLKTLVDKMVSQLQTPAVKNATMKTRTKVYQSASVDIGGTCDPLAPNPGTYQVSGTDNTGDASASIYKEATVTITFNACRDSVTLTEMSGTMQLYWKYMLDGSSATANVSANLVNKEYDAGFINVTGTGTLNGTFNSVNNVTSGTDYANGSFSFTDVNGTGTFFFTGLTNNWSSITDTDGNQVDTVTVNGSFGLTATFTDGMQTYTVGLTITLSGLEDKWRMNISDNSIDHWLNGSISLVWSPAYCQSGTITFTTADATPMHYASISDTCPDTGTVQVNNATIVFEPTQITVTAGGTSQTYPDCTAMEMANNGSGICM